LPAESSLPVEGCVCHVLQPKGIHKTYFDVVVGSGFEGKLPDDVDSIVIRGPGGELPIGKNSFNYNSQLRTFWLIRPGVPAPGDYTFKLVSGNSFGTATDTQSVIKEIALPDSAGLQPSSRQICACRTPTFSWPALKSPGPLYYQLQIRDSNRRYVYKTDYVKDMVSVRIPPGTLISGNTYQWRIRVADGPDWISLNNRSHTRWIAVSIAQQLERCDYDYKVPPVLDDGWQTSSLRQEGIHVDGTTAMMDEILADDLPNIHSVLLIKNGKLVLEEYFNGYCRPSDWLCFK
jgi:hypothetical protein